MKIIRDIAYAPKHGFRGLGDLYLPDNHNHAPAALVIHGGGWKAMDKSGLAGVAAFMAECGFGAYNINYRLVGEAPWPACGDDCLAAADFLLNGTHPAMKELDRSGLVVIGASAGGHLALMTGLRLPPDKVKAIVSIAGPTDLREMKITPRWTRPEVFFGTPEFTDQMSQDASPVSYIDSGAPPLLCLHSINDTLAHPEQSARMVERYKQLGARAELYTYPGPGDGHGIWIDGSNPHRLLPELEGATRKFLRQVIRHDTVITEQTNRMCFNRRYELGRAEIFPA